MLLSCLYCKVQIVVDSPVAIDQYILRECKDVVNGISQRKLKHDPSAKVCPVQVVQWSMPQGEVICAYQPSELVTILVGRAVDR